MPQTLNQVLKDMDIFCTFKVKIGSQNLEHRCTKISSDHIFIKIKMVNPNQESPAFSKAQNEDLKETYALGTSKINKESQKSDYWCNKDHWAVQHKDMGAKTQSGTTTIIQELNGVDVLSFSKSKIEGWHLDHGWIKYSDHLKINIRMPKPCEEPPVFSKVPNIDLKDMDALCT